MEVLGFIESRLQSLVAIVMSTLYMYNIKPRICMTNIVQHCYLANGEQNADCELGKLTVPDSKTCTPGTNLRLFGFGVSCT